MATVDDLICTGCDKKPSELEEYVFAAQELKITPEEYVTANEGTLNVKSGHFLCDNCYIDAGMPTAPGGWRAT